MLRLDPIHFFWEDSTTEEKYSAARETINKLAEKAYEEAGYYLLELAEINNDISIEWFYQQHTDNNAQKNKFGLVHNSNSDLTAKA